MAEPRAEKANEAISNRRPGAVLEPGAEMSDTIVCRTKCVKTNRSMRMNSSRGRQRQWRATAPTAGMAPQKMEGHEQQGELVHEQMPGNT